MSTSTEDLKGIQRELKKLPPEDRKKVVDFAKYLRRRREQKGTGAPTFDWAGRLEHLGEKYTGVELEDQATRWRSGEE